MSDPQEGDFEEEEFQLNAEDIVSVIDLDDNDAARFSPDDSDEEMDVEGEEKQDGASAEQTHDDSDIVFSAHKDSVFCVQIDPSTCVRAVSGGQDDMAYVWNTKTGESIFECTGHKDSVTSVGFSHDGAYVATGDLSGLIKVWKVETMQEVWSFEVGDIEWLQWHHSAYVLLLGTADGNIWMWKIPGGDCKTFQSHGHGALCGTLMPDGKHMCVGYEDGSVKVWDLKTGNTLHNLTGHDAHQSSVVCIDCHHGNTQAITGSTDATAKLINTATGKVITTFACGDQNLGSEDSNCSVETVGLSYVVQYAATGNLSGVLAIWDIPSSAMRHQCHHSAGIVKLKWDSVSPLVYTACLDGVVRLWDTRNGKEAAQWSGHKADILDFDISKDGNSLVTVSEDTTARVFSLQSPGR